MKKSVCFLTFIILLISTILVSSMNYYNDDYYNNYNYYNYNKYFIEEENKLTSKTFYIEDSNENNYYRTFINYNQHQRDYYIYKTDFERKGIYLDFFDRDLTLHTYLKTKKEVVCPEGWICKK
ncbi:MAG: hypothetical protein AABW83_01095 [Nanoarchaeota archaeon]